MAVEKMYLVNMVGDLDSLEAFLEDVIKIGEIEPLDAFNQLTNRTFNIEATTENVGIAEDINNLTSFSRDDDDYIRKLTRLKETLDVSDNANGKIVDRDRVNELYTKLENLLQKKEELVERSKNLNTYKQNIDILKSYNIDIERIKNLNYFDFRYGVVTEDGRFIIKNNYENIPSLIIHLDNEVDRASLNALNEIFELDDKTTKLREDTDRIIENEKAHTREVSLALDKDFAKDVKTKTDSVYQGYMDKAKAESIKIDNEYQAKIENMDRIYQAYKDKVVDDIVSTIVDL